MVGKKVFFGCLVTLGATLVARPTLAQSQHHNGTGNSHGGTYHGSASYSGSRNSSPSIYYSRPQAHYSYPYARYGYSYGRYGYPYGRYPYYRYRYYPSYYGTYYYPYYGGYPSLWSSPSYDSGFYGSDENSAPADAEPATQASAYVTVRAPADARIWFGDVLTNSRGPVRQFDTPPLAPGKWFSYDVKASWNENGKEVTQTQTVRVAAGERVEVVFPVAAKESERIPVPPKP